MQKVNGTNIEEASLESKVNGENFVIGKKGVDLLWPDSDEEIENLQEAIKYISDNIDKIKAAYGQKKRVSFSPDVAVIENVAHKKNSDKAAEKLPKNSDYETDGGYEADDESDVPSTSIKKSKVKQTHSPAQGRQ